jgi:hypothetical protein
VFITVQKSPSLAPVLSQFNPANQFTSYLSNIPSNSMHSVSSSHRCYISLLMDSTVSELGSIPDMGLLCGPASFLASRHCPLIVPGSKVVAPGS